MTEINFTLTRRRILAGVLVIGLAAAAAGVGTFALFSDETTSQDNAISAGTLDLSNVSNSSFGTSGLYPTETTDEMTIKTSYTGGVAANLSVDIAANNTAFTDKLAVEKAELVTGDETVTLKGATLSELATTHGNVTVLTGGESAELRLRFRMLQNATNDLQGATTNVDVTFSATQQT